MNKIWKVVQSIPTAALEDTLNELSEEGYQVYQLQRNVYAEDIATYLSNIDTAKKMGWSTKEIVSPDRKAKVDYDVVAFNPTLLMAVQQANLTKEVQQVMNDLGAKNG